MQKVKVPVQGMTCGGCVRSVTNVLQGVSGVKTVAVSLERAEAEVTFDPTITSLGQLQEAIRDAGYETP